MAKMWVFLSGSHYCVLKQQNEQTWNFSLEVSKSNAEQRLAKQKVRAGMCEGFLLRILEEHQRFLGEWLVGELDAPCGKERREETPVADGRAN